MKQRLRCWLGIDADIAALRLELINRIDAAIQALKQQPKPEPQEIRPPKPVTWASWARKKEAALEQRRRESRIDSPAQKPQ